MEIENYLFIRFFIIIILNRERGREIMIAKRNMITIFLYKHLNIYIYLNIF